MLSEVYDRVKRIASNRNSDIGCNQDWLLLVSRIMFFFVSQPSISFEF